jgi:hypothetical protein
LLILGFDRNSQKNRAGSGYTVFVKIRLVCLKKWFVSDLVELMKYAVNLLLVPGRESDRRVGRQVNDVLIVLVRGLPEHGPLHQPLF